MRIQSLQYSEHDGTPQEWAIEGLSLGLSNLIVGKNASGKSRALNVIGALARNLAGILTPGISSNYDCQFVQGEDIYRYQVKIHEQNVVTERLSINGEIKLDRITGGEGTIFAEEIDGGKSIRFQTPTTQFAAVARRDAIQHKFLEPLYAWASSLRHYQFGTSLGKDHLAIFTPQGLTLDERDPNAAVGIFRQAQKEFGANFANAVIEDLGRVDYKINEIGLKPPISFRVMGAPPPGELMSLYVTEKDLPGVTDQHSMSQGMFRAMALLIHLNYCVLKKSGTCILIDDIGEGLDFDRSCALIDLLREKAAAAEVQLILSTNDRFIMNRVPLEEWSVLQRKANHVSVKNYTNSREIFEEFKFTGMSNFTFLELDVINQPPGSITH